MSIQWPPDRGTVIVRVLDHSVEVGIVSGPSPHIAASVEVVMGWLDGPKVKTVAGCADFDANMLSVWRPAISQEEVVIRAAYIEHARAWDQRQVKRTSKAWIADAYPPGRRPSPYQDGDVVVDVDGSFPGCLGIVLGRDVVWEHGGRAGPIANMGDMIQFANAEPRTRVDVPPGASATCGHNRELAVTAALRRAGYSPRWRSMR